MKYLVISDIHGSYKYIKLALAKFHAYDCQRIIILGDILYHGPRNDLPEEYCPKDVVKLLNEYRNVILAVKGNCDAEVDEMVLDFPLFPELEVNISGRNLLFTHGHHTEDSEYSDLLVHGHTHINAIKDDIINLGSIAIPKDGYYAYAIMDERGFHIYNLLNDELLIESEF